MTHEEDAAGRAYDHRLMRRLLGYLRPYRWQVTLAVVIVLGEALVSLAGPWLTKEAIDHGIRHRDMRHLDTIATLYLAVLAVGFGLGYLHYQIMNRVGQHIMVDLRLALFRHLQRLPLRFYDRTPIGRMMTRVTHDVDVLNELFTSGVVAIFADVFALVGIVVVMAQLNAELLAVTFSVLPLIVIVTLTFRSRVRRSFRDVRSRLAHMNAFLNENLSGMGTVQLLTREERNFEQFKLVNSEYRDANLQAVFYHAVFFPVLELVGALAVSLIVWYGGRQVMWEGITLGTLVAFIQYTQRFFRPVSDLGEKYNILQQAMASSERIFGLLDTAPDPASAIDVEGPAPGATTAGGAPAGTSLDGRRKPAPTVATAPSPAGTAPPRARVSVEPVTSQPRGASIEVNPGRDGATPAFAPAVERFRGRVEFEGVWFAYQDESFVVEDVTFTVEPGEKVALVGATGSGKTTLINLLLRFYEPQRGEIRVDGRALRDWDIEALRRSMGLVLQDVFLFSGTVESNLRLGDLSLPREALERAAREVHAHDFVARTPGGYEAQITERGSTLSAGQRQLLAFARALARDPRLLLLDEATSSVDTRTETLIQDALRRLMAGRTCLVVAHRLSTIQDVDRIVVLHHGRVREIGSHAELLARSGIYTRLYQLQYLGDRSSGRPARLREGLPQGTPDRTPSTGQVLDSHA